jgi:hypothetical protein
MNNLKDLLTFLIGKKDIKALFRAKEVTKGTEMAFGDDGVVDLLTGNVTPYSDIEKIVVVRLVQNTTITFHSGDSVIKCRPYSFNCLFATDFLCDYVTYEFVRFFNEKGYRENLLSWSFYNVLVRQVG